MMKKTFPSMLLVAIISLFSPATFAQDTNLVSKTYPARPKLILVLVIDQLRSDILMRHQHRFVAPGTPAKPGGFRFITQGAWFPFAEYDVLQSMTCPGHAMILSGARPASHGIGTNDWFDPATRKLTYCAHDEVHGLSPRRLRTTTLGDELKGAYPESRVVGVSIKDRSAIMLGGHRANAAVWLDAKSGQWTTSSYYGNPPSWLADYNKVIASRTTPNFDKPNLENATVGATWTLELALRAFRAEKLGRRSATDLLAVSLSTHDSLGHVLGPNAADMETLTITEDRLISEFLREVSKDLGGLKDVWIVLTSDHGIPPSPEEAVKQGLSAGRFDYLSMYKRINERLDKKFGSAGKDEWILGSRLFHFFLNQNLIARKKLRAVDVENEVRDAMKAEPGVFEVFTRGDHLARKYPADPIGQQIRNSYVDGQSGDLVLIPLPFFLEKSASLRTTHITGWSYDRQVPLAIWGQAFKPGIYPGGRIVDLAPTLSFSLGIIAPAMSEGRVLSEIVLR